jgi:hypothetical protein
MIRHTQHTKALKEQRARFWPLSFTHPGEHHAHQPTEVNRPQAPEARSLGSDSVKSADKTPTPYPGMGSLLVSRCLSWVLGHRRPEGRLMWCNSI